MVTTTAGYRPRSHAIALLSERGISCAQIAEPLHVTPAAVSHWLRRRRRHPPELIVVIRTLAGDAIADDVAASLEGFAR